MNKPPYGVMILITVVVVCIGLLTRKEKPDDKSELDRVAAENAAVEETLVKWGFQKTVMENVYASSEDKYIVMSESNQSQAETMVKILLKKGDKVEEMDQGNPKLTKGRRFIVLTIKPNPSRKVEE
jgi:hypothetical protein